VKEIKISKKQFAEDYRTMKSGDVCKKYGICWATLYTLLKRFGISKKRNFKMTKIIFME
jgi:hypothetical protein